MPTPVPVYPSSTTNNPFKIKLCNIPYLAISLPCYTASWVQFMHNFKNMAPFTQRNNDRERLSILIKIPITEPMAENGSEFCYK
jgi:hypothetical protein